MIHNIAISGTKQEQYLGLLTQIKELLLHEHNLIANLANICAVLKAQFEWHWIGFYLVDTSNNTLVLGPFQGPLACTRIPFNKGVCGTAWASAQTQVVPDVHQFPGHIACSSLSQSEIVVPCFDAQKNVVAVLDIDSDQLNDFDAIDAQCLEQLCAMIAWS